MCGIAGLVNFDQSPVPPTLLERMCDLLSHRGPDGHGTYVDGTAGLGHRRLAILDLSSAGHQPMLSHDGRYIISYNGEIYNFRELQGELQILGHRFFSQCDTEVLLAGFQQWGERLLPKLNGMFAFAVWDKLERRLFLARDRYGIKPLYYLQRADCLVFASEIKAILVHPRVNAELDRAALLEYLTFQNILTDRTLFRDVHMLPPGCWATIDERSPELKRRRYWDYSFQEPEAPGTEADYEQELDRLFCQAVSRQLVADVEVGAYLSGGMDSGSITAIAARHFPYLKTFTCGFDLHSASGLELNFDEREKAEHMSCLFRTEHYEMVLKAGDMERCLPKLAWHLEDPRVGQSYPNFYISQLASKFVKVCLAGTGGDELFGGYPWRYYRAVANDSFDQYIDKYYDYWQRLIPSHAVAQVFSPIWQDVRDVDTRAIFRSVFGRHQEQITRPEDYVNHSLYFEAKTFLHGLLVVEDRLSMAHSLETRVPFLDNDLVDFAMRLPARLKLGNLDQVVRMNENEPGPKIQLYYQRLRDGKLLLRRVMARHIPDAITDGIKQGFSAPDASWFKGDSIEYVRQSLIEGESPLYDFLDRRSLLALVNEHLSGHENRRLLIWSLLNLNHWMRRFL